VVGALVRRREEATAPAVPEHDTPAQHVADDLLAQPAAKEGQAQPEAPAAVQPEARAAHPLTRTERTTRENPPSAPLLPTRPREAEIISDPERKPSVKADIDAEIARRHETKPLEKSKKKGKTQQPKQPQPIKSKKKAREK
jgi:hypothetical protein